MKEFRIYERTRNGEKEICTVTPYDINFINFAKENKAKWYAAGKMWIFKSILLDTVKDKVEEIYEVSKKIKGYNTIATTAYDWDIVDTFVADVRNSIAEEYNNGLIIKFKDCDPKMQEALKERMQVVETENGYGLIFRIYSNSKKDIALKNGYTLDFEKEEVIIDQEAEFTEL